MSEINLQEVVESQLRLAMNLVEVYEPNILAAKSYREKCQAQGFSETASETMAMQFHAKLILGEK